VDGFLRFRRLLIASAAGEDGHGEEAEERKGETAAHPAKYRRAAAVPCCA
jgi:hypothetical protein